MKEGRYFDRKRQVVMMNEERGKRRGDTEKYS